MRKDQGFFKLYYISDNYIVRKILNLGTDLQALHTKQFLKTQKPKSGGSLAGILSP